MKRCGSGAISNREIMVSLKHHFLKQAVNQILSIVGRVFFPCKCAKCGAYSKVDRKSAQMADRYFCSSCHTGEIPFISKPYCTKCGIPFGQKTLENHYCENCIKSPLAMGKVRAAVEYKGIVKDAVHLFKYQTKLNLAPLFESWLLPCFSQHFKDQQIDLIIPVPLHHSKTKARGFNQSYVLVRHFENDLKSDMHGRESMRIDLSSVVRIKKTKPQTGYDLRLRKKNLKKAFKVVELDQMIPSC